MPYRGVSRYAMCITCCYCAHTFQLKRTQHTGTAFGGLHKETDVNVCQSKTEIQQNTARYTVVSQTGCSRKCTGMAYS